MCHFIKMIAQSQALSSKKEKENNLGVIILHIELVIIQTRFTTKIIVCLRDKLNAQLNDNNKLYQALDIYFSYLLRSALFI